ncbi:MAG: DUF805 domain-containing protein [Candidatus Nomurabacteria bacterium]|nr:DUF805 domain-containing protein [Candidatus Nomurabacteria bacterium]
MDYFISALKKYTIFSGRATRSEYWYFVLFTFLFSIAVSTLDSMIGTPKIFNSYGLLFTIYYLAILLPSIAVAVRRLHDVGKSGWMLFLSLIPLVGAIWIFILTVSDSNPGENKYGPNPNTQPLQPLSPASTTPQPEQPIN